VIAWIAEADRRSSGKTPPTPAPRINSPKGRFGCRMRRAAEVGPAEQFTNHQVIRKRAFDQGRATAITSVTCLAPRNAWILIGPSGQLRTETSGRRKDLVVKIFRQRGEGIKINRAMVP
jgi:hypothetical protein